MFTDPHLGKAQGTQFHTGLICLHQRSSIFMCQWLYIIHVNSKKKWFHMSSFLLSILLLFNFLNVFPWNCLYLGSYLWILPGVTALLVGPLPLTREGLMDYSWHNVWKIQSAALKCKQLSCWTLMVKDNHQLEFSMEHSIHIGVEQKNASKMNDLSENVMMLQSKTQHGQSYCNMMPSVWCHIIVLGLLCAFDQTFIIAQGLAWQLWNCPACFRSFLLQHTLLNWMRHRFVQILMAS